MRADFLMCGIGSDARGFLHNKREGKRVASIQKTKEISILPND